MHTALIKSVFKNINAFCGKKTRKVKDKSQIMLIFAARKPFISINLKLNIYGLQDHRH